MTVTLEQVKVQQIEKEQQIIVSKSEIERHENELIATVLKQAEIEQQRIGYLARAEKDRATMEAEGQAQAIRLRGDAEAEIIFKKGEAEAKAMNIKAEAFQEYNQAALADKLFSSLPEIVRAVAAPLAAVDRITIVSTGGEGLGLDRLTGEATRIAAQVPALFETLSGMKMSDLLGHVRKLGDKAERPAGAAKMPILPSDEPAIVEVK